MSRLNMFAKVPIVVGGVSFKDRQRPVASASLTFLLTCILIRYGEILHTFL